MVAKILLLLLLKCLIEIERNIFVMVAKILLLLLLKCLDTSSS